MQYFFDNRRFIKAIILTCIIVSIVIPAIEYLQHNIRNEPMPVELVLLSFFYSLIITASITSANLFVFRFYHKKYPYRRHFAKRMIFELAGTAVIASTVITILHVPLKLIADKFHVPYDIREYNYLNILLEVNGVNLIVSLFYETYNFFIEWKLLLVESEQIKREAAESQYLALKNQVNPHFLFNNLNSLSSLIRLSPDKAIEFVDRFSKIYRYVLDISDKMVVKLIEELTFLQSYYYLQKIRFGENLTINIAIDADRSNDYVIPLSVQILIENAIKHNEVSSEHPMIIELTTDQNYLIVSNTLQKKTSLTESTGIGLSNIKDRYKHLTEIKPEFLITNKKYIAKIPLIKEA
jgi:two-component system, LytTR family, sensor kinase